MFHRGNSQRAGSIDVVTPDRLALFSPHQHIPVFNESGNTSHASIHDHAKWSRVVPVHVGWDETYLGAHELTVVEGDDGNGSCRISWPLLHKSINKTRFTCENWESGSTM
jgi:hypothetical protein